MSENGRPGRGGFGCPSIRSCAVRTFALVYFVFSCSLVWHPCQRTSFATGISTIVNMLVNYLSFIINFIDFLIKIKDDLYQDSRETPQFLHSASSSGRRAALGVQTRSLVLLR